MSMIRFNYNGKSYELTYTRETAKQINQMGFNHEQMEEKMPVMLPLLYQGAFFANHRREIARNPAIADEIYASIKDKQGFIKALYTMYIETISTLFDEPEDSEKNTSWDLV